VALKSVIMAGGLGTRLRPLTYDYPKSLMPVDGRPSIFYLLNSLSKVSDQFIITTSYMYEKLLYRLTHEHIFDGFNFLFSIEKKPLGTFGGIKKIQEFLDSTFIVGNADTVFDFSVEEIVDFHNKNKNTITIALTEVENPSEYGVVKLENGLITEFQEKPKHNPISNIANTGLYIMEPDVLDYFEPGEVVDIAKDLIPKIKADKKRIGGILTKGTWIDIGRPLDLIKANLHIAKTWKSKELNNSRDSFYHGEVKIDPSANIKNSYLYDNVEVGKNCSIENSLILNDTKLDDDCKIYNSIVGFESEVMSGSEIYDSVIGSKVIFKGNLRNSINSRRVEDI